DFIKGIDTDFGKPPILLGHLGVDGGFVGKGSYAMADVFSVDDLRPDLFKYVLLGHYHRKQMLNDLPHVMYVGAPIQHSFNDEGEDKGFVVIDTEKEDSIEFIPIPNPKFLTVTKDNIHALVMDEILENGDYLRIQSREKDLESVLLKIPKGVQYKVELLRDYVENTRVDVKIGMSEEEVVKKYAEEFYPVALETGLKILSEVK